MLQDDKLANRIYRSEDQAAKRMPPLPTMELSEIVEFVYRVSTKEWWLRRSPFSRVQIHDGRGSDNALADLKKGIINLPRWSRTKPIVLHELTHLITNHQRLWHGPEFAANLMDMYGRFLGQRWAEQLAERFDSNAVEWQGVRYRERFNVVRPTSDVPRARKPVLITYR